MSAFADSSAVVTLYLDEPGHDDVRVLTELVISRLTRVEVVAAFWGAHRRGLVGAARTAALVAEFEADYTVPTARFAVVEPVPVLLDDAAALAGRHGLRAYDAVQLASARAAAAADARVRTFAAFDHRLREAAAREGSCWPRPRGDRRQVGRSPACRSQAPVERLGPGTPSRLR